jgi:hypothetical protein
LSATGALFTTNQSQTEVLLRFARSPPALATKQCCGQEVGNAYLCIPDNINNDNNNELTYDGTTDILHI